MPAFALLGREATGPKRCDQVATMAAFELAGSPEAAAAILDEWAQAAGLTPAVLRASVRRAVWFDMPFIPVYVGMIVLACLAVVAACRKRGRLSQVARWLVWAAVTAGLLDFGENAALLRVLSSAPDGWSRIAAACAWAKFLLLGAALSFVVAATLLLIARRSCRPAGTWSVPLLLSAPLGNWLLSYPVLSGVAFLLLGVVWRVLLRPLGIPDLFWHDERWPQFLAGVGGGVLLADLGLVGFLLDASRPSMRRLADLRGLPPSFTDETARALSRYLALTSAVLALAAVAAGFVTGHSWVLPIGVLTALTGYAFLAVFLWTRTRLPSRLVALFPRRLIDGIREARGGYGVGGPDLEGLATILMVLRLVVLAVFTTGGIVGGTGLTVPPGLAVCLLLSALVSIHGLLVFFFPRQRFGVSAGLFLVWIAINSFGGHRIRELKYDGVRPATSDLDPVKSGESGLASDEAALAKWIESFGRQGPLIVVAVDGGGVRAATWIIAVLTQLEEDFPDFPYRVRLVTGASGGMLGAAYYVASLQPPGASGGPHQNLAGVSITRGDFLGRISHDSLTPLSKRLVLHDLVPVVSLFGPDRGDAIQATWETATEGVLTQAFRSLQSGEIAGWRPSLVFSPMIVEDGRQLLVSNLELEDLATQTIPYRELGRSGLQFARTVSDAAQLRLSTAVRMNATFPYVMPSLELPTRPALRTVDAGYYDEHGVSLAALWLLDHADEIARSELRRVILIEIPDNLASLEKRRPCAERRSWVEAGLRGFITPPQAILSGRDAVSAHGNDSLLEIVAGVLNTPAMPQRFQSIAFEPPYPVTECGSCARSEDEVALSWYIRRAHRDWLAEGMTVETNRRKRADLCQWWFGEHAAEQGTPACRALVGEFP